MKEGTPTKSDVGVAAGDAKKLTVALGPASKKGDPLTPKRVAPPEPGYEAVTPFQKTSIDENDYYVGDNQSEHVYEEPIWPIKGGKANKELKELKEEEEEEEAGAAGGASLASKAARGYNKPIHPGSKHISSEQLNRLCNAYDGNDDADSNERRDDDDNDVNDNNDDDDDVGYSRPLLQGSRSRLYDDAADNEDDELHNYDEPYVETPHLPAKDADDRL